MYPRLTMILNHKWQTATVKAEAFATSHSHLIGGRIIGVEHGFTRHDEYYEAQYVRKYRQGGGVEIVLVYYWVGSDHWTVRTQ